jgi:hypothetical protein
LKCFEKRSNQRELAVRIKASQQRVFKAIMIKNTFPTLMAVTAAMLGATCSLAFQVKPHIGYPAVRTPLVPSSQFSASYPLQLSGNNNNGDGSDLDDNFDGDGFANYLAPYALAAIAAIVATGAFFNFVLMDY